MDYYAIGQRIRKIRKLKGMSQENLAERVDISVTHMSHIETGNTKLSLEVFAALAEALGARADELLFGEQGLKTEPAAKEIADVLSRCSAKEMCIISDIIKAAKLSLDKYGD